MKFSRLWIVAVVVWAVFAVFFFVRLRGRHAPGAAPEDAAGAAAAEEWLPLDKEATSVEVYKDGGRLRFSKKEVAWWSGAVIATMTLKEYKEVGATLGKPFAKLKDEDFPVVILCNASGFDLSGKPVYLLRASDGRPLHVDQKLLVPRVRRMTPRRDGSFAVEPVDGGKTYSVSAEDWYTRYLGMDARATGVKGKIIEVSGGPAKPLQVTLHLLKGKVTPTQKIDPKLVVGSTVSDLDGVYAVPVPPGVYTPVLELDGKFYGNALKQDVWPTLEVKEGQWLEYDVRKSR